MGMNLEQMYKLALNPKIYPDDRLLRIMQGQDNSLPMAVAMSAKQMRDKQATALKGAQAKAKGAQPSVRDRMVAQAQPQMAGLDQLPAPTMEGMGEPAMGAGGGLVSFATGGFNVFDEDDEDAEDDDFAELEAMSARYGDLGGLGAGIMAVANPKAAKYSSITKPAAASIISASKTISGDNKGISNILSSAAEKHSLPTDLLARIAHSESGGKTDAKNPHSTAKGLFQFTDRTWKGMGGKEGEQFDPVKNADLGAAYLRQNAEGLKKSLGRDPTYGEVYGAHHFGLAGIKSMLNKKHDTPIDRVVSRQVIASNPYLKGKTVGDTLSFLNSKAGTGVVSLAHGGIVGLTGGGTPATEALLNAEYGYPNQAERLLEEEYGPKDKKIKSPKAPNRTMSREAADFLQKQAAKKAPIPAAPSAPTSTIPNAPNMPGGVRGFLQKQAATLGIPGLIYEGGKNLGEGTMSTMAGNPYFENFSDPMNGDFAVGNQILRQNPEALAKAREEVSAVKPTAKAPATNDTQTNAVPADIQKILGTKTEDSTPTANPFAASQTTLDKYLAGLAQQRKEDRGIGMILSGLTTAGSAGPLSSAISKGAQTGLGYYGDAQKGYNTAMAQGLGAQLALDKNQILDKYYGSKVGEGSDAKYSLQLQNIHNTIQKELDKRMLPANQIDAYRQKRFLEIIKSNPKLVQWFSDQGGDLTAPSLQVDTVPGNVIGAIKPK